MGKRLFSFNPFRRKKHSIWRKDKVVPTPDSEAPEEGADEGMVEVELTGVAGGADQEDAVVEEEGAAEGPAIEEPEEIDLGGVKPLAGRSGEQEPLLEEPELAEFDIREEEAPSQAAPAPLEMPEPLTGREDASTGDELAGLFENQVPAKAETPRRKEPPQAVLPAGERAGSIASEDMRQVRDSVESLRRRAMTAGQLKETIERTIESRVSLLKDMVLRIQELFREGAGKLSDVNQAISKGPTVEKVEEISSRLEEQGQRFERELSVRAGSLARELESVRGMLAAFRTEREESGNAVKAAIEGVARSVRELGTKIPDQTPAEELREELRLQGERLVAWLERLGVQAEQSSKQADADRSELRRLIGELRSEQVELGQLRSQLQRVRGNLSASLKEVREELWRSRIARSLLKARFETALEPAQAALEELEAVLKRLA